MSYMLSLMRYLASVLTRPRQMVYYAGIVFVPRRRPMVDPAPGEVRPEFKQVHWNIPLHLYERLLEEARKKEWSVPHLVVRTLDSEIGRRPKGGTK